MQILRINYIYLRAVSIVDDYKREAQAQMPGSECLEHDSGENKNEFFSPPRGSNSQPSDALLPDWTLKSLTLYPIELGGHIVLP